MSGGAGTLCLNFAIVWVVWVVWVVLSKQLVLCLGHPSALSLGYSEPTSKFIICDKQHLPSLFKGSSVPSTRARFGDPATSSSPPGDESGGVDPTPAKLFKDCQRPVNIGIVNMRLGLAPTGAPSSECGGVIRNGLGFAVTSSRFLFRDSDDVDGVGEEGAGEGWNEGELDAEQVRPGAAADAMRK